MRGSAQRATCVAPLARGNPPPTAPTSRAKLVRVPACCAVTEVAARLAVAAEPEVLLRATPSHPHSLLLGLLPSPSPPPSSPSSSSESLSLITRRLFRPAMRQPPRRRFVAPWRALARRLSAVKARACRNRASASRLVTPRSCMRPMASCTRSAERAILIRRRRWARVHRGRLLRRGIVR